MNKRLVGIIIFILIISVLGGLKFISLRSGSIAEIKVLSNPPANIFLNDKLIGKTPFDDRYTTGEYLMKLIPDNTASGASSWQGKVSLNPSVLTYVNRELGTSELLSSGETLTLEKTDQNQVQLAVNSQPGAASVLLDGMEKGSTPIYIADISPGEYDLAVSAPGFIGRTVRIQLTSGYKLIVNFQLALTGGNESTESAVISPTVGKTDTTQKKPYVVIKDTPTGFLRVRMSPSITATETAQIKPEEKYPLLDEKESWYKVSISDNKEGWISSRYAQKVE
jgi:hypothetical protein